MKRTLGLVLAAALVPAIASAQSANDPYAPGTTTTTTTTTNTPTTTNPAPQNPAPATTTPDTTTSTTNTTVVTPPPTPPQPPVVVVQPEPQPTRTIIREEPVDNYEVHDAWNAPVFATGAVVFAGSYGASAIVAATSDHPGANRLYVPVVGPWLALNDWGDCPITNSRCDSNTTDKVLLVGDGVLQAAGVITMVTGLLSPTTHTVHRHVADKSIHVTPTHNGVMAFGQF